MLGKAVPDRKIHDELVSGRAVSVPRCNLSVGVATIADAGPFFATCLTVLLRGKFGGGQGIVQTRHVGNNWVPLVGLALLFLTSGALSMVADRGNGVDVRFFALGTLLVGALSAAWLWKHPSWWIAPRNHYLYLAAGTAVGVLLSALLPFLNGAGPWLVLGAAIVVYGYFERLRLLMTVGSGVVLTGLLVALIRADIWGGALHLLATAIVAIGANRLHILRHGRRREAADSAPDFIGSFEEFDRDEALRP